VKRNLWFDKMIICLAPMFCSMIGSMHFIQLRLFPFTSSTPSFHSIFTSSFSSSFLSSTYLLQCFIIVLFLGFQNPINLHLQDQMSRSQLQIALLISEACTIAIVIFLLYYYVVLIYYYNRFT
jgi:hypothetical protein